VSFLRALVALTLVLVLALGGAFFAREAAQTQLANRVIERDTLARDISQLQQRLDALKRDDAAAIALPSDLIWQAETQRDAEFALQDAVVAAAEDAGLVITTFGVSRYSPDTTSDAIAVELETEAELSQLYQLLAELEAQSPKVAIGALNIRQGSRYDANPEDVIVFAQIIAWAFWDAPI